MWAGPTYQSYYLRIGELVRKELDAQDSEYLLNVDFEDYLAHLVQRMRWEPLDWNESGITIEAFSVQRTRSDGLGRSFQAEEDRLRLRIPISDHPQLKDYFEFGPSTTRGSEPEWGFEDGVLVHEVEASEHAVERGIDDVRFWIENRNKDIEKGNEHLPRKVREVWEVKRGQLEQKQGATAKVIENLKIPLHQDPDSTAKPVQIKPRNLGTVIEKPKAQAKPEPAIDRTDVVALVDFVDQYTRQFEVAPTTYERLEEEELRDLLVGMMNANYPGSTTGETFNKLGKTDICLRVDSGNVLICECKFWAGAKAYDAALDQLFDYLTWRQNYAVLITFSKLKDMSKAISEGQRAMTEHLSFVEGSLDAQTGSRFVTRHSHPQDDRASVQVFHLFVDLGT